MLDNKMRTQWSDTKCELKVFQFWFQTFLKLYKIWKVNDVSGSQTGTQMIKQQLSGFVFQTYINNLTARLNSMFLVISFLQWWHIWKNLKTKRLLDVTGFNTFVRDRKDKGRFGFEPSTSQLSQRKPQSHHSLLFFGQKQIADRRLQWSSSVSDHWIIPSICVTLDLIQGNKPRWTVNYLTCGGLSK